MILINSFESSCGKIDDLNLAQFLYSFDKLKLGLGLLTNAPLRQDIYQPEMLFGSNTPY